MSVDASNCTCPYANPDSKSLHEMYILKQASLGLLLFLVLGSYERKRTCEDHPNAAPCFYLRPAKNHLSSTARVLAKGVHSDAIPHDVTWREVPTGKKSCLRETNSSTPQVTREKDYNDKADNDDESGRSDKLSTDVNPGYTDSVSSDTSDDVSVENFRESSHDVSNRFGRDVDSNPRSLAELSDESSPSGVSPTVTNATLDCLESRGVYFAETTEFPLPSESLSTAAILASRRLAT